MTRPWIMHMHVSHCVSQLLLMPEIRYELKDGDNLRFANVQCVYTKSANKQQVTISLT